MMVRLTAGTQEAQELTGFGHNHIRKLVREGKLPNVGNSKRVLIPRSAIICYLEQAGQK
jgi:excisionase family DNA binding protein